VSTPATLESRLDRLERAERRTQTILLAIGVLLLFVGFVMPFLRQEVAAETFAVKSGGTVRATLRASADGIPALTLYDDSGHVRANLSMRADGSPDLVFSDAGGSVRAALRLTTNGVPTLYFADQAGTVRAVLGLPADGLPSLVLLGDSGRVRYMTPSGR
jgi:hypothetical protein